MNPRPRFDIIVVGAGAAGWVVAVRLARVGASILLLEAGPQDRGLRFQVPLLYYATISDPTVSWGYSSVSEAGLEGRAISHPRGRVLGGSTSTNGLVYIRGAASDFDAWAEHVGDPGWSFPRVLELFRRSERNLDHDGPYHGTEGELDVAYPDYQNPLLDAFVDTAVDAGIARNPDFNGPELDGVGWYQLTAGPKGRSSASRAFLGAAPETLVVWTDHLVTRVRFDCGRAIGVEAIGPDGPVDIDADGEVILCCGAFNSPQILHRSGIGPRDVLRGLDLPPVVVNGAVGAQLQDHLQVRILVRTSDSYSLNSLQRNRLRRGAAAARYMLGGGGPFSIGAGVAGLFGRSDAAEPAPDFQLHVIPFSSEDPGRLHAVGGVTFSICSLRPYARGHVRTESLDPRAKPRIWCNYLGDPRDYAPLRAGVRLTESLLHRQPLAGFVQGRIAGDPLLDADDDELNQAIRACGTTIFHPACTCAMGPDGVGVVDAHLRVRGVQRLRVADASVMPSVVSGNTAAAVMMIGERCADLVRAALGLG